MPTYRCKACKAVYVDPQPSGVPYYHACGPIVDPITLVVGRYPNERDENVVLDFIPGKDPREGHPVDPEASRRARMKKPGLGRELLDPGDVVSHADAAALKALQEQVGQDVPDPPDAAAPLITMVPPLPPGPGP